MNGPAEVTVASGKLVPVASSGVVTEQVGLAITINVSPLGVGAAVAAPAGEVVARMAKGAQLVPVASSTVVAEEVGLAVTIDVSPVGLSCFTAPCFMSPCFMPRSRPCYAPTHLYTRGTRGCGSFGLSLFDALGLFFLVSTFAPLIFCILGFVLSAGIRVFMLMSFVKMVSCLFEGMCCGNSTDACGSSASFQTRHGTSGHSAAVSESESKAGEKEEETMTVRDLSAMRVEASDNTLHIHLGAPGVRPADLSVQIVDDSVLSVTGETKKGTAIYRVDRRIQLPFNADPDQLTASHADGELTLVVKRKVRRVKLAHEVVTGQAPPQAAATETTTEESTAEREAKEDEWEPLPKAANCAD